LTQLRVKQDELQARLLQQYADFVPYRVDPECPQWLAEQRSGLIKDALHGQALIRATGELCITDL
jgi:chorismate mutase